MLKFLFNQIKKASHFYSSLVLNLARLTIAKKNAMTSITAMSFAIRPMPQPFSMTSRKEDMYHFAGTISERY